MTRYLTSLLFYSFDFLITSFYSFDFSNKFPWQIAPAILVLRGLTNGDKDEAAAQVSTALEHLEEAFVKCSQGKHYFGGDRIGFLDLVFGSHLGWFRAVEKISGIKLLEEDKYPEITAWADRFCTHHAVKDVMPETDKLVEFSTNSAVKAKPTN
jgi:glutathione S-transferase